eukprot:TRINITY_DN862_c2_g1_i1.p1 TRINITY_DN862_c2_g1~~TRINITY_DN862_c2_g1_i1.p1  ORF type:complete len:308 (+),score=85.26 TRINITY_DN862_c2_g1_i1:85-1008(+)
MKFCPLLVVVVLLILCCDAKILENKNSDYSIDFKDGEAMSFSHENWQTILDKYLYLNQTVDGITEYVFDYEGLRRNQDKEFSDYISQIENASPLDDYKIDDQFAILMNAYNVFAVNMIINNPCKVRLGKFCWPIRSIKDISGFFKQVWDLPAGKISGIEYTLNDLEFKIRSYNDSRIHACIVCASVSCPNLQPFAYNTVDNINLLKNQSMQNFLKNTKKGLKLDESKKKLYLSSIFLWYGSDFANKTTPLLNGGDSFGSVLEFVLAFAPPSVQDYFASLGPDEDVKILYFDYDWKMNAYSSSTPPDR